MSIPKKATLIEYLVEYDGPQLCLLKTDKNRFMFAVAVTKENMSEPYFSCEVNEKNYNRYFDQTVDLHFLFSSAWGDKYYFFDLSNEDNSQVNLVTASNEEVQNPSFWPEVGFFANSHTSSYERHQTAGATRSFRIDGRWGAKDFSKFHGKWSDLYALFGVLGRLDGEHSATERAFVKEEIQERFWQGGGSYVGFYDSLETRNRALHVPPLEVARISYASPGQISLRGSGQVLADTMNVLDVLEEAGRDLENQYKNIWGGLKKEGMLSAEPDTEFPTDTMRDFIYDAATKLAIDMRLQNVDKIFEASDQNVLVFTKVILSIYRRAKELHMFHAEGRVQRLD